MKRRVLSALLALCLMLSLMPEAWAAPGEGGDAGTDPPAPTTPEEPKPGTCGENLTWSFNSTNGLLIIRGSGRMTNYSTGNPAPWHGTATGIRAVVVDAAVESFGDYAFDGCTNLKDIYYLGTAEEWKTFSTGEGNAAIDSCGRHYENEPCLISYVPSVNSATGEMPIDIVEKNRPFELPKCEFTLTGRRFRGWRIDNSEEIYPIGYQYTPAKDSTLTAFWEDAKLPERTYTITFLDVEGITETHSFNYSDAPQALLLPTPFREGYDFSGWTYTIDDYTQSTPTLGPVIVPAKHQGNLTLTAHWASRDFAIIISGNGSGAMVEIGRTNYSALRKDQSQNLTIDSEPGYRLLKIDDIPGVTVSVLSDVEPVRVRITIEKNTFGDKTLRAVWGAIEYKITCDPNGGVLIGDDWAMYTVEDTGLGGAIGMLPSARREGYNHRGWTCDGVVIEEVTPGDYGYIMLPEGTTGNLTFKAVWEPEVYEITYEANDGTGTMPDGEATYGEPFTLPVSGFTAPAGKQFGGWHIENGAYDEKGQLIYILDADGKPTTKIKKDFVAGDVCYFKNDTEIEAIWHQIYKIPVKPTYDQADLDADETLKGVTDQEWTSVETVPFKVPQCTFPTPEGKSFEIWRIKYSDNDIDYVEPDNEYIFKSQPQEVQAVWENRYTITYKPGEGTGTDVTEQITETKGKDYKLPKIEDFKFTAPEGKNFAGWVITVEGSDVPVTKQPDESYSVTGNITVTAIWAELTYTVKFDSNGGTGSMADGTGVFWAQYTLPNCSFTPPAGMQFDAWEVEGTRMAPGEKFRIMGDTTVKALWKKIGYSIEFVDGIDEEGKPIVVGTIDGKSYEDTVTLLEGVPGSDQTLKAWEIKGKLYAPGNTFNMEEFAAAAAAPDYKITATAVWPAEGEEPVTITYASGYSTNEATDPVKVFSGVTFGLPASCTFAEPPAAEMTFAGWSKAGIGGAKFDPSTDTATADATFYALWEGKIDYELNGGTIAESAPKRYIYKEAAQDLDGRVTDPVRPGYIFDKEKGWELSDESVRLVSQELKLPAGFKGTLTLTAHWKNDENVYLVIFDANGGTGEMATVPVNKETEEGKNTTYTLPACTFTPPTGMAFDCWTIGETEYKAGDTITLTDSVTVKAKWKDQTVDPDAPDHTVTFDPGEGTGTMDPVTVKEGQWYDLPACTFEAPEGKEFDCWSIGGVRQEEGRIFIEGDVTLTALWKDKEPEPEDPNKPWTITFDAGGGTGTMSPATVPKAEGGATYTLPACGFTAPEGKTFQAWKVGSQEYAPGAVITVTGDTTVTAVWKDAEVKPPAPTSYAITYNLNGGYMTGSGPTRYNVSDQAQTLNVPVPYKSGFTFLGWTYSGVSKPTKSVVIRANMTGDLTVVANWQMNPGSGNGSGSTSQGYYISVSATAGGEIYVPWEYANQGAIVSVQARPQPGYEVGGVTVVNSQGFEVGNLQDLGGGNYSFTMPGYRVNVSATFVLQSASAAPITRPVMNFEDVRMGDWYYDGVEYVYNRGMMSGISATQFGPNGQATRGAIWTALAANAGFDINGGSTWYERGQYWAMNRGITDGASPSGAITREQLVTMLWRCKGSPAVYGGDLWQFADGFMVSAYAMDAMRWAVSTGLMGGANGRLNPQATTTRAEAATILARFCQS